MDFSEISSLSQFINYLNTEKGSCISFSEFKDAITTRNVRLSIKENDTMAIIFNDEYKLRGDETATELERNTRSVIIDIKTMKIICSQTDRILYNDEAVEYIQTVPWENVEVQTCYEGTTLTVFHHNDSWHVSTRRCLDANESFWNKSKSHGAMFIEAIKDKFGFSDLDKNCTYTFVLVHYQNKNLVSYNYLGKKYANVILTSTQLKFTNQEVAKTINDNVIKSKEIKFKFFDYVLKNLDMVSDKCVETKDISSEGFILKVYPNGKDSGYKLCKLQTALYKSMVEIKPNVSNTDQIYLELYQKDKLMELLPYFSKYGKNIKKRLSESMKTTTKEILDLYHATRNKKNKDVYESLPEIFRRVLYGIHGIYIANRKKDFEGEKEKELFERKFNSISVHDVYHYLKKLDPSLLRTLFLERSKCIKSGNFEEFFDNTCIYTKAQTSLMFGSSQPVVVVSHA
jgi:hypothetical protein